MKKLEIGTLLYTILLTTSLIAQVGIGTTTPNAQLDIVSTNQATPSNTDGILIPKIDEYPLTPPTSSQDGMLVYATGAGSVTKGFYYWDNVGGSWVALTAGSSSDADWYEEGTTTVPNAITDNIFTNGEVGIGTNVPAYAFDILESSHDRGINLSYFRTSPTTDIAGIYAETNDLNTGNTSRGFYNFVRGADGNKEGVYNRIEPTGAGIHVGTRNQITNGAGGTLLGVYNVLNSGASTANQVGVRNQISVTNVEQVGIDNILSGGGDTYGVRNNLTAGTTGFEYGISNSFSGSGDGFKYGLYNSFSGASNASLLGSYTIINGTGIGVQRGHRVDINTNNSILNQAFTAVLSGTTDGNQQGVDILLNNSGNGIHYGVYNRLQGTGNGDKYGAYNWLTDSGNGTHYGTYNEIRGTGGGNKYGTVNIILNSAGGTHYGIYSQVLKPGSYAGYFDGNLYMSNGRAEFITNTDASPTTGSGVLEIGGNLRIDNNEIITNTGSVLYLQHDNDGDLRVDNTTLMVDASTNRIGIGTLTPGYTLDVVGDINTSGNIRRAGGAYNFPDYVFESYYDGESSFKPNYKLKDLSEIEKFIKENKHLPGVQSREDVSENGWNISENVQTNLEKIEELFLYVIEIKKENELLKEKVKQLEAIHLKD